MSELSKEAMEYLVGIAKPMPTRFEIDGQTYLVFADGNIQTVDYRQRREPLVKQLGVTTLTSFIDYITVNRDNVKLADTLVQITGPASVRLLSVPKKFEAPPAKEREFYISSEAVLPEIHFDKWIDTESFVIMLQAAFAPSVDRENLMKYVGNIQKEESVKVSDDGISQKIATKTGIATVENVVIPNPVSLRPYRTFQELKQPASDFVFRIRENGQCALFEADGGAWKVEARKLVKAALLDALKDVEGVVVIG